MSNTPEDVHKLDKDSAKTKESNIEVKGWHDIQ